MQEENRLRRPRVFTEPSGPGRTGDVLWGYISPGLRTVRAKMPMPSASDPSTPPGRDVSRTMSPGFVDSSGTNADAIGIEAVNTEWTLVADGRCRPSPPIVGGRDRPVR